MTQPNGQPSNNFFSSKLMATAMIVLLFPLVLTVSSHSAIDKKSSSGMPKISAMIVGLPLSRNIGVIYINAGQVQGVVPGMEFGVFRNGKRVAVLEVTSVQQKMAAVAVVEQTASLKLQD